jgi:hypothetical protein
MRNKLIIITLISLFSFSFTATGQKLINSPYSRFNIGTLEPAGSFRSLGMGGLETGMRDNNSIFFSNPASYSSLDTSSFVFDFGLDYSKIKLSDGVSKYSSDDMNFDHLLMGFPIAKGWGVALGIVPLSNGYYQMTETIQEGDPGYNAMVGGYSTYHAGEGGFTNFFLGSGIRINKNFSVGANMKVIMGQVRRLNEFVFNDFYYTYHDNSTERLQLSGINFDYGLQYSTPIKKDYFFNAGISLSSGKNYNSKFDHIVFKYTAYSTSDTISYVSDDSTKAFIPGTLKAGISFGKINKLTVGIDFSTTKWSTAKIPGPSGYAADTKSWIFGAEYIPDRFSNYSYLKRIAYRVGGHIEDNYLIVNGEQIKEYGATIGLGIPMRTFSRTNLFFDFTRKTGSAANGLHNENYYTMGVSLNLYDWWFIKKKYD